MISTLKWVDESKDEREESFVLDIVTLVLWMAEYIIFKTRKYFSSEEEETDRIFTPSLIRLALILCKQ